MLVRYSVGATEYHTHSLINITSNVITTAYCAGSDPLFKRDTQHGEQDRKQMLEVLGKSCKGSAETSRGEREFDNKPTKKSLLPPSLHISPP